MSLRRLEEALPALLRFRSDEPRGVDWNFLMEETGIVFPRDFVELAEAYPPFAIDEFLGLHIPCPGQEGHFVSGMRGLLRDLSDLRESGMSHEHVPYPEPGGLIPWGDSCEGDVFFWRANETNPQSWTVLVSGHNDDWCEFNGTLTAYLAGLVTGAVPPDGLPPDFPGPKPAVEVD